MGQAGLPLPRGRAVHLRERERKRDRETEKEREGEGGREKERGREREGGRVVTEVERGRDQGETAGMLAGIDAWIGWKGERELRNMLTITSNCMIMLFFAMSRNLSLKNGDNFSWRLKSKVYSSLCRFTAE